jgi:hypothetical protein
MRFGDIACLVFTGKVKNNVGVEVDAVKDASGKETGVRFLRWSGVKHPPCEISIPFYNLKEIKETA